MSDFTQLGLAGVVNRLQDVESGVASLAEDVPMLIAEVTRLDGDVDRLITARREALDRIEAHDATVLELAATVRRLAVQVAWIEQHLRNTGSARPVDLDDPDAELVRLAAVAEAGRSAASALLSESDRAVLTAEVARHRAAVARHRQALRAVVAACGAVATGERGGVARRQARADYAAARGLLAEAADDAARGAEPATAAATRLAADDAEVARTRPAVAAGERAGRDLLTRLRTRVATAVGDGAMLPAWLTGPLGPMPVAGEAQKWLDVAAGLLAYRITYGVTDPVDAVGEVPPEAGERRRRWHADLGRGVRELLR